MSLLFTLFSLTCVLHVTLCCTCAWVKLEDTYCPRNPPSKKFLIQAEVIWSSEPRQDQDRGGSGYTYRRYILMVKETYRDDTGVVKSVNMLDAATSDFACGVDLDTGKTYVLAGTSFVTDAGEEMLRTNACEYSRRYDTAVDITMPDCRGYRR